MNQQREVIYAKRRHALLGERLKDDIFSMLSDFVDELVEKYYDEGEIAGLREDLRVNLLVDFAITAQQFQTLGKDGVKEEAIKIASEFYKRKEEKISLEIMGALERMAMLQVIDIRWKEHLREMDDLKEGIHLRAA